MRFVRFEVWVGRTTAKLVRTDNASQPLVIGGICATQASIPTGIVEGEKDSDQI
jgi:hypothetical protein